MTTIDIDIKPWYFDRVVSVRFSQRWRRLHEMTFSSLPKEIELHVNIEAMTMDIYNKLKKYWKYITILIIPDVYYRTNKRQCLGIIYKCKNLKALNIPTIDDLDFSKLSLDTLRYSTKPSVYCRVKDVTKIKTLLVDDQEHITFTFPSVTHVEIERVVSNLTLVSKLLPSMHTIKIRELDPSAANLFRLYKLIVGNKLQDVTVYHRSYNRHRVRQFTHMLYQALLSPGARQLKLEFNGLTCEFNHYQQIEIIKNIRLLEYDDFVRGLTRRMKVAMALLSAGKNSPLRLLPTVMIRLTMECFVLKVASVEDVEDC